MGTRHLYWILTSPYAGRLDQADFSVGRGASHPIKASREARNQTRLTEKENNGNWSGKFERKRQAGRTTEGGGGGLRIGRRVRPGICPDISLIGTVSRNFRFQVFS